ncbi:hypothetical protein DXA92_07290 [Agathobaculum butyriciproducens]|nr:hypothetical protein DXA94_04085 [Agathobaculum butyriciproducens]RGC61091.1 hypothetical protein DXA92_07290 [Agathobaculum butyriciproducens]
MKRWVTRGLISALLFMTARYAFIHAWGDARFMFSNFFDILSGNVSCPAVDLKVVTSMVASAGLAGMLINTIPKKHPEKEGSDDSE